MVITFDTPIGDLSEYLTANYDDTGWWDARAKEAASILADPQKSPTDKRQLLKRYILSQYDQTLTQYVRDIRTAARELGLD